jgi:putative transposase
MSGDVHVQFLEGLRVKFPWSTQPYIRVNGGFVYLAAVIDWYSKAILSHKISNTMDESLVLDVFK